jgi:hypothetical protein
MSGFGVWFSDKQQGFGAVDERFGVAGRNVEDEKDSEIQYPL